VVKPWSFRGWMMYIIGKVHLSWLKRQNYILVAMYYFTKYVKAITNQLINQETIIKFIKEHIIHMFGLLETITTN
jgi:hypothetical protein